MTPKSMKKISLTIVLILAILILTISAVYLGTISRLPTVTVEGANKMSYIDGCDEFNLSDGKRLEFCFSRIEKDNKFHILGDISIGDKVKYGEIGDRQFLIKVKDGDS